MKSKDMCKSAIWLRIKNTSKIMVILNQWQGAWRYHKGSLPGSPHLPGTQGLTCVMSLMVIVSDHILKQTFEDMNIQS